MKRFLSAFVVTVLLLSMLSTVALAADTGEFAGGSGTQEDPYLVSTKAHLNNVRHHLDSCFKMTNDIEFSRYEFDQVGPYSPSGMGWAPIGSKTQAFTGEFDGNGFAIKNLKINMPNVETTTYAGLFAYAQGAKIQNLGIENSSIRVTTKTEGATLYVGAICGAYGEIKNCYNTGSVTAEADDADVYAAGICPTGSSFENCYNTGNIYASSDSYSYAGGITTSAISFTNCYNTGNVEAWQCGGIATHSSYGDLKNCYNTGNIYATRWAGGIVASISKSDIEHCYNTGYVYSKYRSGGITASATIGPEDDYTITNCYNTGSVVSSMTVATISGGIVGQNEYYTVSECYNMGNITATAHFEGYASGGGISGVNIYGKITNCYNTGKVSAASSGAGSNYCGGIVGDSNGEICYCYSVGKTAATSSETTQVGGIVGKSPSDKTYNCYYLFPSGTFPSGDTYNSNRLKTDEQLQKQETYLSFDFDKVWVLATEGDYRYPLLKGNHQHIYSYSCDSTCHICSYTRTVAHSFGEYISDQNATCAADGTKTAPCTVSGCNATDTIQENGSKDRVTHTYGPFIYNNDATTQKDGTQTRTCSVCGKEETLTAEGTKLNVPFTDIKPTAFYYNPVLWAIEQGITTGVSKTSFAPNTDCTRGQIATFLWRAAGRPSPKTNQNPFTDVKKGDYYYEAVLWAVGEGITSGVSKTSFAPGKACTRGQIATFLWRAGGSEKVTSANPFADVKKGDYYYNAVLWAANHNITTGTSKTAFSPNKACTRGQIATFLYRNYN